MILTHTPRSAGTAEAARVRPLVLHVRSISGAGGGPEKTIIHSQRRLEALGYDVCCAYLHSPGEPGFASFLARAQRAGATIVPLPERGLFDWRLVKQLAGLCREKGVAVWHGHDYKSDFLGWLVRKRWPMKLVATVHGWVSHTRKTPLYYTLDKWSLRRYDRVICVSGDLYDECLRFGVPAARCRVIENAIDTEDYRRTMEAAVGRRSIGAPSRGLLIGAMGRLAPEKGFDLLIRAVHSLLREGRDVALWIAGEGPEGKALQSLIDGLGCGDRIRLCGYVEDTKTFFQALDLFVLSSLREGLPNVLLEAMALEVPVVATGIAGVPALVLDSHNGALVPPRSVEALAAALRRLCDAPDLRRGYAAAARRTIEESFSFRRRMEREAAVYKELLERR
jgi:glycosyltransferase involved in cell wall biosynthesis